MTELATLLFAAILSVPAFAANPAPVSPSNPCMKDLHKYCKDVVPGEGRLAKCMEKHASELSASCKEYGKKYEKEHPGIKKQLGTG